MTNKNITLTIPNDDAIALHEFGAAMQRMAGRHGLEVHRVTDTCGDLSHTVERALVDTDKAQLAALGEAVEIVKAAAPALMDDKFKYDGEEAFGPRADTITTTQSHLDSDGLPWDARIHASSKERNADDTWRARRKPADMDPGQWAEFQGQVRTELRALMAVPVVDDDRSHVEEICAAEAFQAKCDELHSEAEQPEPVAPIIVEPVEPEPIVVAPPPAVEPVTSVVVTPPPAVEPVAPVVVAPPQVAAGPTEFVPFLQWITAAGHTTESVAPFLAKHGLTEVKQLQQRPDLIPQVHASIVAGV